MGLCIVFQLITSLIFIVVPVHTLLYNYIIKIVDFLINAPSWFLCKFYKFFYFIHAQAHCMNEAVQQQQQQAKKVATSVGQSFDHCNGFSTNEFSGSQPCSTLFVANLEPHHTEEDISLLFKKLVKINLFIKNCM